MRKRNMLIESQHLIGGRVRITETEVPGEPSPLWQMVYRTPRDNEGHRAAWRNGYLTMVSREHARTKSGCS